MSDITDFIAAAVEDKPMQALKSFSSAIEPKILSALDQKREEITAQLFNKNTKEDVE